VTALATVHYIISDRHRHSNTFRENSNLFPFEDHAFTLLGVNREQTMVKQNTMANLTLAEGNGASGYTAAIPLPVRFFLSILSPEAAEPRIGPIQESWQSKEGHRRGVA
jgi:hypothetical protein